MAQQTISDGESGLNVRTALNSMFTQIYSGDFGTLQVSGIPNIDTLPWAGAWEANRQTGFSNDDPISTLVGFGGSADATQTSTARPLYKDGAHGINGQPALSFDGTNDFMSSASGGAALTGDWYMATVVRFASLTGFQAPVSWGDQVAHKRREMLKGSTGYHPEVILFSGYSSDVLADSPTVSQDTNYLLEIKRVTNDITIYVNGVQTITGNVTDLEAYSSNAIYLGANPDGGELLNGLMSLLVIGASPDATTIGLVRLYVKSVYGIAVTGAGQAVTSPSSNIGGLLTYLIPGLEPEMAFNGSGLNTLRLKNTSTSTEAYSGLTCVDPGAGDKELFTFAFGRSDAALYPWHSGYIEMWEGQGGTELFPIRIVMTSNSPSYSPRRRMEFEGHATDGPQDIVFYAVGDPWPDEPEMLRLTKAGGVILPYGSIEFGEAGTRTHLTGTAASDIEMTLPPTAGALALRSYITIVEAQFNDAITPAADGTYALPTSITIVKGIITAIS